MDNFENLLKRLENAVIKIEKMNPSSDNKQVQNSNVIDKVSFIENKVFLRICY